MGDWFHDWVKRERGEWRQAEALRSAGRKRGEWGQIEACGGIKDQRRGKEVKGGKWNHQRGGKLTGEVKCKQ